ncbi:hypothetical protein C2G38_2163255 [Gigaspora rosea]|uniref:Uncharacterized protein n=1 Tax=Gigaspora rosea TaxID=44941 RepID=A0A397VYU3_9GLOM|nr:hypothetical protein C2G38_2163255 [Gigaspora rosea]
MSGIQEEIQEGHRIQLESQPTTSQGLDITATTDETAEDTEPALSDELRKVYHSLDPGSYVHYHNLPTKPLKVTFLKAIITVRKAERKRGVARRGLIEKVFLMQHIHQCHLFLAA